MVIADVELGPEAGEETAEDNASLVLVVWDITCVLNELGQIDVVDVEIADLGLELNRGNVLAYP